MITGLAAAYTQEPPCRGDTDVRIRQQDRDQAAYQAFANADLDGAMQDMADDIEWIVPGNSTISGTYRGKDEVRQLFVTLAGKSFRTEPEHFVADGDHVIVLSRVTADGQSSDQAAVLTFREGKIVKFQASGDTAQQEKIWGSK